MNQQHLQSVEGRLTTALLTWSISSVAVGASIAWAGHRMNRDQLVGFGRQTVAWGAIDAVIAGVGALSRHRRGELTEVEVEKKVRSLRKVLLVNAAADVAYVVGGIALVSRSRKQKSDMNPKTTLRMGAGDGLAIVIQGAFLFVLDVSQVKHLPVTRTP
jgi:hypothetical protein